MDVFDLQAHLGIDINEYRNGLGKAKKAASDFAKVAAAAFAAAGTATVALGKKVVDEYSQFEQLEGGIETLFGESAVKVMEDASAAFETAGMSMNKYMETSIQSAASLINSLEGDQAKAAELMNMSIVDMSDNVNKMGTTMESVQNAYRGFSRGNFTMLDNLALGFSGTKEGMQELLDKAEEISGIKYDISSYSDIIKAIHAVQTEMGITGTTAKEAEQTISGSINAFKSAISNYIVGLGNADADTDKLFSDVERTAETALNNILPIIKNIVKSMPKAVKLILKSANELLPDLLNVVKDLFSDILSAITLAAPEILNALSEMFVEGINSVVNALPELIPALLNAVQKTAESIMQVLPKILEAVNTMLPQLLPQLTKIISEIAIMIVDNISIIIPAIIQIFETLSEVMIDELPILVEAVLTIIEKILDYVISPENYARSYETAIKVMVNLATALLAAVPKLLVGVGKIIAKVWDNVVSTDWTELGKKLIENITAALQNASNRLMKWWDDWSKEIAKWAVIAWNSVVETWSHIGEWFSDRWQDIKDAFSSVGTWFGDVFNSAVEKIKDVFSGIRDFFSGVWDSIKDIFSGVSTWFKEIFTNAWDNIKNVFAPVGSTFQGIGDGVLSGLKSVVNNLIGGINNIISMPFNGLNDALTNIKNIDILGNKPFSFISTIQIPQIPQLAKGGVLKRGQIALLEGQGDEAVIPLSQNTEWIEKISEKLDEKSSGKNFYYTLNFNIEKVGTDISDIENFAEQLMEIIAEKQIRRGLVY